MLVDDAPALSATTAGGAAAGITASDSGGSGGGGGAGGVLSPLSLVLFALVDQQVNNFKPESFDAGTGTTAVAAVAATDKDICVRSDTNCVRCLLRFPSHSTHNAVIRVWADMVHSIARALLSRTALEAVVCSTARALCVWSASNSLIQTPALTNTPH